jgi:hypothetical protein
MRRSVMPTSELNGIFMAGGRLLSGAACKRPITVQLIRASSTADILAASSEPSMLKCAHNTEVDSAGLYRASADVNIPSYFGGRATDGVDFVRRNILVASQLTPSYFHCVITIVSDGQYAVTVAYLPPPVAANLSGRVLSTSCASARFIAEKYWLGWGPNDNNRVVGTAFSSTHLKSVSNRVVRSPLRLSLILSSSSRCRRTKWAGTVS